MIENKKDGEIMGIFNIYAIYAVKNYMIFTNSIITGGDST